MQWDVVATVAEPSPLVCSFVAHHLWIGAERVHIFLDEGDPVSERLLRGVERCEVTVCDAAYWAGTAARPRLVTDRQKHNAQSIYDRSGAEWLLHADADEFVRSAEPLRRVLSSAPAECVAIRLPVVERVHETGVPSAHIFDGVFRRPAERRDGLYGRLYGTAARFLNRGVKAYAHFKSLYRRGRGLAVGVHAPLGLAEANLRAQAVEGWPLLHFDGMTARSWAQKMERKAAIEDLSKKPNAGRVEQLRHVLSCHGDPSRIVALYRAIDGLTAGQRATLDAEGLLDGERFCPRRALSEVFPGTVFDLGEAAFDAAALDARWARVDPQRAVCGTA